MEEGDMAFKKILVAIDRSSQAPLVFEQALQQAQVADGCLMLVHVVRPSPDIPTGSFMGMGTIADIDTYATLRRAQYERVQKEVEQAQDWIQAYVEQAAARGVPVETDCRSDEPAVWICKLAQNWGADLIVLGRRGHQGIKEIVLGSVSNYVVHHATCAVLVVQGVTPEADSSLAAAQSESNGS
jgi:nucleotide-binding universal stress UspA family protein